MLMDISLALKNPGQPYPFERELTLPPMEVLSDPVQFEAVRVTGTYTGAGESVTLAGRVRARVISRCALCLDRVSEELAAEFSQVYVREPDSSDPDLYPLSGSSVELDELVRDALLLALPLRFVCSRDCKGLCPVCGVNRNQVACSCQEGEERQNPFSALRELLTEDEEV